MLASHNILNPANGAPIQYLLRIWFGSILYDQSVCTPEKKILGQDLTFYSAEEVNIAE
jgi:DNA-directed RNA polymerase subunit beta'